MFLASGLTVTEALACNTPLVIFDAIPGQEEENAQFLEHSNVGIWLKKQMNIIILCEYKEKGNDYNKHFLF